MTETVTERRWSWTEEESAAIRQCYPDGGWKACQPLMPYRTLHAIRRYASALGVRYLASGKPRPELRRNNHDPATDQAIADFYQAPKWGGLKRLAAQTGRRADYLKRRATELGVVVARMKTPDWSDKERNRLHELAAMDPRIIQRILVEEGYPPRTATAIVVERVRLGAQLSTARADAGWYTMNQLAPLVGVSRKTVMRWISHGWLVAHRGNTDRQDDFWLVHERDLRTLLMNHAESIPTHKWNRRFLVDVLAQPAKKTILHPPARQETLHGFHPR